MRRIPHALLILLCSVALAIPTLPAGAQEAMAGRAAPRILRPPDVRQEYYRAERAWHSGSSLVEAKTRLDRVVERMPEDYEALRLRARVQLDLFQFEEALADADRVVALVPDDPGGWLLAAESRLKCGRRDDAIEAMERAVALVDDRPEDHLALSWIAETLGFVDRAEAHARVALAMAPRRPAGYRRLAHVFMAQQRPDDAATLLSRALTEGVFRPDLLRADGKIAHLASHPLLRAWF